MYFIKDKIKNYHYPKFLVIVFFSNPINDVKKTRNYVHVKYVSRNMAPTRSRS